MPCFSEYSMLSPHKESNDVATISSSLLTTNWEYLFFDIMTENSHQKLDIIVLKNGYGLIEWSLVPLWPTIKTKISS